MPRNGFNAPGGASIGAFSNVVVIDGFYYLSGQVACDPPSSAIVLGTITEQTGQCFANLIAVLEAAGLALDNVIKCNTYLTDMKDFDEYDAAYRSFFAEPYPARTTVQVAALPMGANIEIEMVAHA